MVGGETSGNLWGAYQSDHQYVKNFIGRGTKVTGYFTDIPGYYGDNSGSIAVDIYASVAVGRTTTSLTTSASTAVYGKPVTLTASVTANSPATGVPSGTVTFFDGQTILGVGTLSGGTANLTAKLNAGTHAITAVYGGAQLWSGSSSGITQTITPATLVVVADDKTKDYGAELPTLTYSSSGFVDTDSPGLLTGTLTTTATAGSDAGSYPIAQGSLSAGANYAINFKVGSLVVTKAILTVTASDPTSSEAGRNPGVFTFHRPTTPTSNNAPVTVLYELSGTASAMDFDKSGSATIPAGADSVSLTITPIDDGEVEANESVVLTITGSNTPNYTGSDSANITINDNDGTISVTNGSDAAEPTSRGWFNVHRDGGLSSAITVRYNLGGTATPGLDFKSPPDTDLQSGKGLVTFGIGVQDVKVAVDVINDLIAEGTETVNVSIESVLGGTYDATNGSSPTVNILDDEPFASLSESITTVVESDQAAEVRVSLDKPVPLGQTMKVAYSVHMGTATPSTDYVSVGSGVIVFVGGEDYKTITIPLVNDLLPEQVEQFSVTLDGVTGGGMGDVTTTVVKILDDDQTGSVGDIVWHDLNADGIHDSGEPGIDGVTVQLIKESRVVAEQVTANGGLFTFTNLPQNVEYRLKFLTPNGKEPTLWDAGIDDSIDSDIDANGNTFPFKLTPDRVSNFDLDAGYRTPMANPKFITPEDTALAGTVATPMDEPGSTFELAEEGEPAHGFIDFAANGSFTYVPDQDYFGPDSFTYFRTYGTNAVTVTASIKVLPVNDAPVAYDQFDRSDEDSVLSSKLLATDVDNAILTFSSVTAPAHGTLTMTAGGVYTYTPEPDFHGDDSFTFVATDSAGATGTGSVTLTVDPVNDAPTATDQSLNGEEDEQINGLLAGTDIDGDILKFSIAIGPAHGTVIVTDETTGAFVYTPNPDYHGSDSFTFDADDGTISDEGTVTLSIASVNDAPVPQSEEISTEEDKAITVTASATDVDDDKLTYSLASKPVHGVVTFDGVKSFTYTPDQDYHGPDGFNFNVTDALITRTGGYSITVTPVNDTPVAYAKQVETLEDTPYAGKLAGSDIDGDPLSFSLVSDASHGSVVVGPGNGFTYIPNPNFFGVDSFTFKVSDGQLSDTDTVKITVTPVGDSPKASDVHLAAQTAVPTRGQLTGYDPDGDTITFAVSGGPTHGTVTVNADGSFTYTSDKEFFGVDTFGFTVTSVDGQATGTATIKVSSTAPEKPTPNLVTDSNTYFEGDWINPVIQLATLDPQKIRRMTLDFGDGYPAWNIALYPNLLPDMSADEDGVWRASQEWIATHNPIIDFAQGPGFDPNNPQVRIDVANNVLFFPGGGHQLRDDGYRKIDTGALVPGNETPSDPQSVFLTLFRGKDTDLPASNVLANQPYFADSIPYTVKNVAPDMKLADAGGAANRTTGWTQHLVASIIDPGMDDFHDFTIDWGDNEPNTPPVLENLADQFKNPGHRSFEHIYKTDAIPPGGKASSKKYTATVRMHDDDQLDVIVTKTITFTVVSQPPALDVWFDDAQGSEGSSVRAHVEVLHYGDPDLWVGADSSTTILWGDEAANVAAQPVTLTKTLNDAGQFQITGQFEHTYVDNQPLVNGVAGDYPVTVKAIAAVHPNAPVTKNADIRIDNVIPDGLAIDVQTTEAGEQANGLKISGTFTDPGVKDSHTVVIDWGDGTIQMIELPAGTMFFGSPGQLGGQPIQHIYATTPPAEGFVIHVRVFDKDRPYQPGQSDAWYAERTSAHKEIIFGRVVSENIIRSFFDAANRVKADSSVVESIFRFVGNSINEFVEMTRETALNFVDNVAKSFNDFLQLEATIRQLFTTTWPTFLDALLEKPETVIQTLLKGAGDELTDYFNHIDTNAKDAVFKWMSDKLGSEIPELPTDATPKQIGAFLLKVVGLSWTDILAVAQSQLGAENVELIINLYDYVQSVMDGDDVKLFDVFDSEKNPKMAEIGKVLENITPESLVEQGLIQAVAVLKKELPIPIAKFVLAALVPQAGALKSLEVLYKGVKWFSENISKVQQVVQIGVELGKKIDAIKSGDVETVRKAVREGLKKITPVVLSFGAAIIGMGDLPTKIAKKLTDVKAFIRTKLEGLFDILKGFLVTKLDKLTPNGGAAFTPRVTPVRSWETGGLKPQLGVKAVNGVFETDIRYEMTPGAAAELKQLSARITVWDDKINTDFKGDRVTATANLNSLKNFLQATFNPKLTSAQNAKREWDKLVGEQDDKKKVKSTAAIKTAFEKYNKEITDASQGLTKRLADLQDKVDPVLTACDGEGGACFAAGTKLWTPAGYRSIEDISAGDLILSRSEAKPGGFVEEKVVEEVFVRFGEVLHLHVGGQTIRTTTKHPFYVYNQGWTPVNELEIGQWILTEAGDWKAVEEIYATGEWEVVYNLRIEEHHTYFVGDEGWGWSLWAHNACKELYVSQDDANPSKYTLYYKDNGIKVRVPAGKNLPEGTTVSESSFADAVKYAQTHKVDLNINPSRIMTADPSSLGGSYSAFVGKPDVMGHANKAAAITDFDSKIPQEKFIELIPKTGSKTYPTDDEKNTFIHAHHIVMKNSSGAGEAAARESRQILRTVGIEPFLGVQNLVFAPNWANHSKKPDYPQTVLKDLQDLGITPNSNPTEASIAALSGKKAEVEAKLKEIARLFFVAEYSM